MLLWWVAALLVPGRALPTPIAVIQTMVADGFDFYTVNLAATLGRVVPGYLWGTGLALLIAAIVLVLPALSGVANQLGVLVDCLPITAIGPIIMVIFGGRTAAIFLSGLVVFFSALVTALIGVHAAKKVSLDLVRAYGGGRIMRLRKVQAIAALPSVFAALRIAVPAAFIGALVGEYLGGIDSGIGVALQAAQREILPARAWGLCIVIGLISLGVYALLGLVARLVLPWANTPQSVR